jgi:hypothetical protein
MNTYLRTLKKILGKEKALIIFQIWDCRDRLKEIIMSLHNCKSERCDCTKMMIRKMICIVMNQGKLLPPVTVYLSPKSFDTIGPYAVAKIFAALNHMVLRSIWRKLKICHLPRQVHECLTKIDSVTENVMQFTLRSAQYENCCTNIDSNLPSIIIKIEGRRDSSHM